MKTFMLKSHRGLRSATLTALLLAAVYIPALFVSCINPLDWEISVTLSPTTRKLSVGESAVLTATVSPAGTAITWSSSNTGVATVNNGTVTAVAAGTAVITVTSAAKKAATCEVTVRDGGGGTGGQQLDVSDLYGNWQGADPRGYTCSVTITASGYTLSVSNGAYDYGTYTVAGSSARLRSSQFGREIGTATFNDTSTITVTTWEGPGYIASTVILYRQSSATGDFTWTDSNGEIAITGYTGTSKVVVIPVSIDNKPVTSIRGSAFSNNQLTSVTIPSSVASIGDYAFQNNQLTSMTIPSSVTSIGNGTFTRNQLASVTFDEGSKLTSIRNLVFDSNQLTSVTIPSSVTSIGNNAFDFNQLASVTIPSSVTSIGDRAFNNNQLTSVTIPSSVTFIGNNAFAFNQLASVTFDEGSELTSIGDRAFNDNQLTSVAIPSLVTSIGVRAFYNNQLNSVYIGANVIMSNNSFDGNLASTYNSNSEKGGTYTRETQSSSSWTYEGP